MMSNQDIANELRKWLYFAHDKAAEYSDNLDQRNAFEVGALRQGVRGVINRLEAGGL